VFATVWIALTSEYSSDVFALVFWLAARSVSPVPSFAELPALMICCAITQEEFGPRST